jgi:hypothetical protein
MAAQGLQLTEQDLVPIAWLSVEALQLLAALLQVAPDGRGRGVPRFVVGKGHGR